MEKEVHMLENFEKYDTFSQVTNRKELATGAQQKSTQDTSVSQKNVKPIGIYELNPLKT
jgi:hypothetical protein